MSRLIVPAAVALLLGADVSLAAEMSPYQREARVRVQAATYSSGFMYRNDYLPYMFTDTRSETYNGVTGNISGAVDSGYFTPTSLRLGMHGNTSASGTNQNQGAGAIWESQDIWTFDVAAPTPFRMSGTITENSTGDGGPIEHRFGIFSYPFQGIFVDGVGTITGNSYYITTAGSYSVTGIMLQAGQYSFVAIENNSVFVYPPTTASTAASVDTTLEVAGLAADANLDDVVDTLDFNILAANFAGSGKTWFDGDFSMNSTVDTVDFNILTVDFGHTLPAAGGATVPEPVAAGLLVIGGVGLLRRRRR